MTFVKENGRWYLDDTNKTEITESHLIKGLEESDKLTEFADIILHLSNVNKESSKLTNEIEKNYGLFVKNKSTENPEPLLDKRDYYDYQMLLLEDKLRKMGYDEDYIDSIGEDFYK